MKAKKRIALTVIVALSLVVAVGSIALAAPKENSESASQPEMTPPPGWTQADVQACMLAGMPGEMQTLLARDAGVWRGESTVWMFPGADPATVECTSTVKTLMDGRYTTIEMSCEMPGMGPYSGFGVCGFDNVSQKFVSTWVDNHSTGIMNGEGKLSEDGKTLEWEFTFNCPVTGKPAVMREVDSVDNSNAKSIDMFAADPKSGKEYKVMHIELSR